MVAAVAGADGFLGSMTEDVRGFGTAAATAAAGLTELIERVGARWRSIHEGCWFGSDADEYDTDLQSWIEKARHVVELLIELSEALEGEARDQDEASAEDGGGAGAGGAPSGGSAGGAGAAGGGISGAPPADAQEGARRPWEELGLVGIERRTAQDARAYLGPLLSPDGENPGVEGERGEQDGGLFGGRLRPDWLLH